MSQLNLNTNYIDFDNGRNRIIVNGPAEISNDGKYEIVKFLGDGTFQITKAARPIEYLVVGGGGPGGAENQYVAGGAGGGGGQFVTGAFNSVANYQYQVKVGAGGTSTPLNINIFNATGGLENTYVSDGITWKSHTFISGSGTLEVGSGFTKADILVVGGGGGGATGGAYGTGSQGGQGGQVVGYFDYDLQTVALGSTGSYTITVGNGGASDTAGETSSFYPDFTYTTGFTITALGGQAGLSGSQERVATSGSGFFGFTSMSYFAAPGGNGGSLSGSVSGTGNSGSLLISRKAQNWRYRVGGAGPYGTVFHPTIYDLALILETPIVIPSGSTYTQLDYATTFYANPNCSNLGLIPSSGSTFVFSTPIVYANQKYPANITDAQFYCTAGKVNEFQSWPLTSAIVFIDFQDQYGNWIPYMQAVATNSDGTPTGVLPCGNLRLVNKVYLPTGAGSGDGGNGIANAYRTGTDAYFGGGGGGGVYEGFAGYFIGTGSQNLFTGSLGGLGGGGNGAGALLTLTSGSLSGSLSGLTGSANTGGGGGGGFSSPNVGSRTAGGAGGSGIVIIRYPISGSENQFNATGSNGGNSSLSGYNLTASYFSVVALGGGAGGGMLDSTFYPTPFTGKDGQNGGSGGGAGWGYAPDGVTVQTGSFGLTLAAFGNDGAAAVAGTLSSGGGGGAAAAGSGKNGGAGLPIYISGSGTTYAGAGGAAYDGTGSIAFGSGSYGSGGSGNGGQGADGVVIVRFSTSAADNLY